MDTLQIRRFEVLVCIEEQVANGETRSRAYMKAVTRALLGLLMGCCRKEARFWDPGPDIGDNSSQLIETAVSTSIKSTRVLRNERFR